LALEWPNQPDHILPAEVMQAWRVGHGYAGARIQISMHRQQGYLIGFAVANERLAVLTKTERIVAQQFASGYSNKDIANQLSVSQNTVRSHIAHIYTKLGVHDKAQLANCIARKAGQALVHIQNRLRLEQK
jgi:DNA-binding NarL/FixJ family response regulator